LDDRVLAGVPAVGSQISEKARQPSPRSRAPALHGPLRDLEDRRGGGDWEAFHVDQYDGGGLLDRQLPQRGEYLLRGLARCQRVDGRQVRDRVVQG
jgi:hypothetical protein